MKIYDCFTFYNEFDLLDLRIAEMYDHVDYMVLVEADHTFQNEPKHFNFKHRMKEYEHLDKLIYIGVEDMPLSSDPWVNERHQRDSIMLALKDENDRGNIVNSEDVELELSWNKTIEVTDIPINFGTIEECIQEELIRFMNYEEDDIVESDNE